MDKIFADIKAMVEDYSVEAEINFGNYALEIEDASSSVRYDLGRPQPIRSNLIALAAWCVELVQRMDEQDEPSRLKLKISELKDELAKEKIRAGDTQAKVVNMTLLLNSVERQRDHEQKCKESFRGILVGHGLMAEGDK